MSVETPAVGHNRPAGTPFDAIIVRIDLLNLEAQNWLDGDPVATQGQADAIARLLDQAREARKAADELRKAEARPFDDGKAAVQAKFKPWLSKCDRIADSCKQVLAPFLAAKEREKREAEIKARADAEAKADAARRAFQTAAGTTDIVARERAEALAEEAKAAERAAAAAAREKGHARGGARAVGLRTHLESEVTDHQAFARYVWEHHQDSLRAFLDGFARELVRSGRRNLPGVTVHEEKRAV